jgi:hypothetical protein
VLYRATELIGYPVVRAYFRSEVTGLEHVVRTGAAIIAANHLSAADETSHAFNLSSRCGGRVGFDGWERSVFFVFGPGGEAVVQDADHAVEQVALGGDVSVAGGLASVVVCAGAG